MHKNQDSHPYSKNKKKKKTNAQIKDSHHYNRPDRNRTATPTVEFP